MRGISDLAFPKHQEDLSFLFLFSQPSHGFDGCCTRPSGTTSSRAPTNTSLPTAFGRARIKCFSCFSSRRSRCDSSCTKMHPKKTTCQTRPGVIDAKHVRVRSTIPESFRRILPTRRRSVPRREAPGRDDGRQRDGDPARRSRRHFLHVLCSLLCGE